MDGRDGNDEIYGGYKVDKLIGGKGADLLCGGGDNDIFVLYQGHMLPVRLIGMLSLISVPG